MAKGSYPFWYRTGQYVWEDHRPRSGVWKGTSGGEAISFSGCDDNQTSADTSVSSDLIHLFAVILVVIVMYMCYSSATIRQLCLEVSFCMNSFWQIMPSCNSFYYFLTKVYFTLLWHVIQLEFSLSGLVKDHFDWCNDILLHPSYWTWSSCHLWEYPELHAFDNTEHRKWWFNSWRWCGYITHFDASHRRER